MAGCRSLDPRALRRSRVDLVSLSPTSASRSSRSRVRARGCAGGSLPGPQAGGGAGVGRRGRAGGGSVLPARVPRYDPADLEYLTLSGAVTWGRLTSNGFDEEDQERTAKRRQLPGRNPPLAFVLRGGLPA